MGRVLDTCYDVTGHDEVVVPSVALLFGGGARLDVDASGIVLVADVSQACLAFAPNADRGSVNIIANMQQRTHTMVFDVDGGSVGFHLFTLPQTKQCLVCVSECYVIVLHKTYNFAINIFFIHYRRRLLCRVYCTLGKGSNPLGKGFAECGTRQSPLGKEFVGKNFFAEC